MLYIVCIHSFKLIILENMKYIYRFLAFFMLMASVNASAEKYKFVGYETSLETPGEWAVVSNWVTVSDDGTESPAADYPKTKTDVVVIPEGCYVRYSAGDDFSISSLQIDGYFTNTKKTITVVDEIVVNGTLCDASAIVANNKIIVNETGEIQIVDTKSLQINKANGTLTNNGKLTALGATSYLRVLSLDQIVGGKDGQGDYKAQYTQNSDDGAVNGLVYVTTVPARVGQLFSFGECSENYFDLTDKSWTSAYAWKENYLEPHVCYEYYPGKTATNGDVVVIPGGKICNLDQNPTLTSILVNEDATLYANDGRLVTVDNVVNNGTIKIVKSKTLTFRDGTSFRNDGHLISSSVTKAYLRLIGGEYTGSGVGNEENVDVNTSSTTYYWKNSKDEGNGWSELCWYLDPECTINAYYSPQSSTDNVVIPAGSKVTLNVSVKLASLNLQSGSILTVNDSRTLTIDGEITLDGDVIQTHNDSRTLTLAGAGKIVSAKGDFGTTKTSKKYINVPSEMLEGLYTVSDGQFAFDETLASGFIGFSGKEYCYLQLTTRPSEGAVNCYAVNDVLTDWSTGYEWTLVDGKKVFPYYGNAIYHPGKIAGYVDNAIVGSGKKVTLNNNYTISSIDLQSGSSLNVNDSRTLTANGSIKFDGDIDFLHKDERTLTLAGTGKFVSAKGTLGTTKTTKKYINVPSEMLTKISEINEGDLQISSAGSALLEFAGKDYCYMRITTRPDCESINLYAYNTASTNWNADNEWTLIPSKKVFAYFDSAKYYPGLNASVVDNVIVPESSIVALNINGSVTGSITINGQINCGAYTLYVAKNASGTGVLNENAVTQFAVAGENTFYTTGITYVTSTNPGLFYSSKNGNWDEDKVWSVVEGSNVYYYPSNAFYYPNKTPKTLTDKVIVREGTTVELNSNITIATLQVDGTLRVCGDAKFEVKGASVVNGTMDICENSIVDASVAGLELNGTLSGAGILYADVTGSGDLLITGTQRLNTRPFGTVTFYSAKEGKWNVAENWSIYPDRHVYINDYYPGKTTGNVDDVVFTEGNTITMTGHHTVNNLTVNDNAEVIGKSDKYDWKLTVNNNAVINGRLSDYMEMLVKSNVMLSVGDNASSTIATVVLSEHPGVELDYYSFPVSTSIYQSNWTAERVWSIHPKLHVSIKTSDYGWFYPSRLKSYIDRVHVCNGITINDDSQNAEVEFVVVEDGSKLLIQGEYNLYVSGDDGVKVYGTLKYYNSDTKVRTPSLYMTGVDQKISFGEHGLLELESDFTLKISGDEDLRLLLSDKDINGIGTIRLPYSTLVDTDKYPSFKEYLADADNYVVKNFLDAGGTIEFTSRPNDRSLTFYLTNADEERKWGDNKIWSLCEEYKVFLYIDGAYYYPCKVTGNLDGVNIPEGQKVSTAGHKTVTDFTINGQVRALTNLTFAVNEGDQKINVGEHGSIIIGNDETPYTLTISPTTGIKWVGNGGSVSGNPASVLWLNPNLSDYCESTALASYVDNDGILVLSERPECTEDLTFYFSHIDEGGNAWTTNKKLWSIVEGKKVFVYTTRYYYPTMTADLDDSVVIPEGQIITEGVNGVYLTNMSVNGTYQCTSNHIIYLRGELTIGENASLIGTHTNTSYAGRITVGSYDKLKGDGISKLNTILNNFVILINDHDEEPMTFYSTLNEKSWNTTYQWSLFRDAAVYVFINGNYYYPGCNSQYPYDNAIIQSGHTIFDNVTINNLNSIGDFTVEEGATFNQYYINGDNIKANVHLKTTGEVKILGQIMSPETSWSYLYVADYSKLTFDPDNLDLINSGHGNIFIYDVYPSNPTFYARMAADPITYWSTGRAWSLNHEGKHIYYFPNDSWYYPGMYEENSDNVVIPADVTITGNQNYKTIQSIEIDGQLNLNNYHINVRDNITGTGRLQVYSKDHLHANGSTPENNKYGFYDTCEWIHYISTNPYTYWSKTNGTEPFNWNYADREVDNWWRAHENRRDIYYYTKNSTTGNYNYYHPRAGSLTDTVTVSAGDHIVVSLQRFTYANVLNVEGTLEICRDPSTIDLTKDKNDEGYAWMYIGELNVKAGGKIIMCETARITKSGSGTGLDLLNLEDGAEITGNGIIYVNDEGYNRESSVAKDFVDQGGTIRVVPKTSYDTYYSCIPVVKGKHSGSLVSNDNWSLDENLVSKVTSYPGKNGPHDNAIIMPNDTMSLNLNDATFDNLELREGSVFKVGGYALTVNNEIKNSGNFILGSSRPTIVNGDVTGNGIVTLYSMENLIVYGKPAGQQYWSGYYTGETRMVNKPLSEITFYANYVGNWVDGENSRWTMDGDGNKLYLYNNTFGYVSPGCEIGGAVNARNSDNVVLRSGADITVNDNISIDNLIVEEGAILRVCGGNLTVRGKADIKGKVEICDNGDGSKNGYILYLYSGLEVKDNTCLTGPGWIYAPVETINKTSEPGQSFVDQGGHINTTASPKLYRFNASSGNWNNKSCWDVWDAESRTWKPQTSRYPGQTIGDQAIVPEGYKVILNTTVHLSTLELNGEVTHDPKADGSMPASGDIYVTEKMSGNGILTLHCLWHVHITGENPFFKNSIEEDGTITYATGITRVVNSPTAGAYNPLQFYARGTSHNWTDNAAVWSIDENANLFWYPYNSKTGQYEYYYPYKDNGNGNPGKYMVQIPAGTEISFSGTGATDNGVSVAGLTVDGQLNVCGAVFTVEGKTVINGEVHICNDDPSNETTNIFQSTGYIHLNGKITGTEDNGTGRLRIPSEDRIILGENGSYEDILNNGQLLITSRIESVQTFYSAQSGDWRSNVKSMWKAGDPHKNIYYFTTHTEEYQYTYTETIITQVVKKDPDGTEIRDEFGELEYEDIVTTEEKTGTKTKNVYGYYAPGDYTYSYYYDRVVIQPGHTMTLSLDKLCYIRTLEVQEGATLYVTGGDTLRVNSYTGNVDITVNGKMVLCDNAVLRVNSYLNGSGELYMPKPENLVMAYPKRNNFANKDGGKIIFTNLDTPVKFLSTGYSSDWTDYRNWVVDVVNPAEDTKPHWYYGYTAFNGNVCDPQPSDLYYPGKFNQADSVVVSEGSDLKLDVPVTLSSIEINGNLTVAEANGDNAVYLTTTGDMNGSETGVMTLEYAENIAVEGDNNFFFVGKIIIKHETEGQVFYLYNSDRDWADPENWSTDPTTYVNEFMDGSGKRWRYPGKVLSDVAVIPAGKTARVNKNVILGYLKNEYGGHIKYDNADTKLAVCFKTDGYNNTYGTIHVYDLEKNFVILDNCVDKFLANGTVEVLKPCIIPSREYGSLIINYADYAAAHPAAEEEEYECRVEGDFTINKDLTIDGGSVFTLGKDIVKAYYSKAQLFTMAKEGKNFPAEYDVFINATVKGDVKVNTGGTLRGASVINSVRNGIINYTGLPVWSNLDLYGDLTVDGRLDFAVPNDGYGTHGAWAYSDRKVTIHFNGNKDASFHVNGFASIISMICDKTTTAELSVDKSEAAEFYMNGKVSMPDFDHNSWSIVLNSGILRLGSGITVDGWGASRYASGGYPQGNLEYNIRNRTSNMAVYRRGPHYSSALISAVAGNQGDVWRVNNDQFGTDDSFKLKLQKTKAGWTDPESTTDYYLDLGTGEEYAWLDAYTIFKRDLEEGMVIPAGAKLIIDGATVNVGRGYTKGELRSDGSFIGHLTLRGALEVTNNGVLNFENSSVGIIYDNPDGSMSSPAELSIKDGGKVNVSRIYGLHGRKLNFSMSGDESELNFIRSTNGNIKVYDDFFKQYGNGDITQGKAQGCIFSMKNGGSFNMEGGLIFFNNYDAAQRFTVNGFDLSNCTANFSGGELRFTNKSYGLTVYIPNDIHLHDVSVYGDQYVTFMGDNYDPTTFGYVGKHLYIDGNLTIDKNKGRMRTPENLHVGGNIYIRQREGVTYTTRVNEETGLEESVANPYDKLADTTKPLYSSYETGNNSPNLFITGSTDSYLEVPVESSSYPIFTDLVVAKTNANATFTIKGRPFYMWGDLTVNRGKVATETEYRNKDYTHVTDSFNIDGIVFGAISRINHTQNITVEDDGDLSMATLSTWGDNNTYTLNVNSDVTVKNFNSSYKRRIILNNNKTFTVTDNFSMPTMNSERMFVNPVASDQTANGGLVVPLRCKADSLVTLPVGISYYNSNGALAYAYTRCIVTTNEAVDGYMQIMPCNNWHPQVKDKTTATKMYWRLNWTDRVVVDEETGESSTPLVASNSAFTYDFCLPAIADKSTASYYTQTMRCDNSKVHDGHSEGEMASEKYWEYTKYYQWVEADGKWYECGRRQTKAVSGAGYPTFPYGTDYAGAEYELPYHSGDFTDGYHFDTDAAPKTFYSCADGEWDDATTWTLSEDFQYDGNELVPTKLDRVVIGNNHKVTTDNTSFVQAAKLTINADGTLDIAEGVGVVSGKKSKNYVGTILGKGTLIYNVDPSQDWVKRLDRTNYLQGDHSDLFGNSDATLIIRNAHSEQFVMPSEINEYPDLVIEGNVKSSEKTKGIRINGNLVVESGAFDMQCAIDKSISVAHDVEVKSGAQLSSSNDASTSLKVAGNIDNAGDITLNSALTEIAGNISNNGTLTVAGPVNFVSITNSEVTGNAIMMTSTGVLQVNKETSEAALSLNVPVEGENAGDVINTDFVSGTVNINSPLTDVKLASYRSGQQSPYFDLPSGMTLNVNAGKVELYGTSESSLRLGGALYVENAELKTTNALGYSTNGSKLTVGPGATFVTTQIAPYGSTGAFDFVQSSADAQVTVTGGVINEMWGLLDVRGGSFKQVANAKINVLGATASVDVPTFYYAPRTSTLASGSAFVFDDADETMGIYTEHSLQSIEVAAATTAKVVTRPVTLNSKLIVDGTLDMNDLNLVLNNSAVINGTYVSGTNTTYLSGSSAQSISGSASSVEFYNLVKNTNSTATIDLAEAVVANAMTVSNGKVDVRQKAIQMTGKTVTVDYQRSLVGMGVEMCGTDQQMLLCEGSITNLVINNDNGVNAATSQTYPLKITQELGFKTGNLIIGGNSIVLEANANIVDATGTGFGSGKMIQTNLVIADEGVKKNLASSGSVDIMIPIGYGDKYAPVAITGTQTSSNGYIRIVPVGDYYIGIEDEIKEHVMSQYWQIKSSGISDFTGTISFTGDVVTAYGIDHEVDGGYATAVYFDGKNTWDVATGTFAKNDPKVTISIDFSGASSDGKNLDGFYMAGCASKLPTEIKTYISVVDGDWSDAIWKEYRLNASGTGREIVESEPFALTDAQMIGCNVYINSDVDITENVKRVGSVEIMPNATLNIGNTINHYFGVVRGSGTIKINHGNLPSANYAEFVARNTGGTIEYSSDASTKNNQYNILLGITSVNNLKISGKGQRLFRTDGVTTDIYGTFMVDGDAALKAVSSGPIRLYGNVIVNSGSLTGTGTYIFCNESVPQYLDNQNGGTITIGGMEINNPRGVTMSDGTDLVLSEKFALTSGVLHVGSENRVTVNGSISGGSPSSYVDGVLGVKVESGKSYTIPVGDGDRYAAPIVTAGKADVLYVRYYHAQADQNGGHKHNGFCSTLGHEYWTMGYKGGEGNVTAKLPFDIDSQIDVSDPDFRIGSLDNRKVTNSWTKQNASVSSDYVSTSNSVRAYAWSAGGTSFAFGSNAVNDYDWTGKVSSDWFDENNWAARTLPDATSQVYIKDGCDVYPVIQDDGAGRMAQTKAVWIWGENTKLTITNGGNWINTYSVVVEDKSNVHIHINNRYDKSCNVKIGGNFATGSNMSNWSNKNDYNKIEISNTIPSNTLYYLGSSTVEGTISSGFNPGNGDYLASYVVKTEKYNSVSAFTGGYVGHTLGLVSTIDEPTERSYVQVGSVNVNSKTFNLDAQSYDPTSGAYGWYLISNPYTYAYPLENGAFTWSNDVSPVIWFRRFNNDAKKYYYSTFSLATMQAVKATSSTSRLEDDEYCIAPQQAFFIKTLRNGQKFTFNKNYVTADNIVASSKLKTRKIANDVLRLNVSSDKSEFMDEMAFVFREGGTMEATMNDADKRFEGSGYNQIYSFKDGGRFAIPFYPAAAEVGDELLPLGVQLASGATEGTITATNLDVFDYNVDVYLYDFERDVVVDLREVSEYQFSCTSGTRIDDRFAIGLKCLKSAGSEGDADDDNNIATKVDEADVDMIMITRNDNNEAVVSVSTNLVSDCSMVYVYDMSGAVVNKATVNATKTRVKLGDAKAIYIVEVIAGDKVKSTKLRSL